MAEQISIFDYVLPDIEINKKIRLISLFSGYDSQAMALQRIGADFEHYRAVEFDEFAVRSLNAVHGTNFPSLDIREVHGEDLEIMDRDKYTYLMTYSFPCGLPGTKIKVSDGYKNIEDVEVGEKVLTHNNRYEKVTKVMRRISPDYYKIKVLGYPKLLITSEHPMYVLRDGKIQWVKVKELTEKDKVCFNINTEEKATKCSDKVLWMLGRYAADGHINKYTYNSVNFSIGYKKEEEFLNHIPDEMIGRFKRFEKSCADYRIADADFQELCEECGNKATNKRIPQWILDLPKDQAKEFLDGYLAGDCHKRADRSKHEVIMFCTASKELFLGIQSLIMKVYGVVCICYLREDKRKDSFNDTYNGQFSLSCETVLQERIGDHIFTPIRSIKHIEEESPVFNFEVENDNSYTMENMVVHNCTDISVAGQQKGFAEDSGTRSALLWEVKRILEELKEIHSLPDILLMENVVAIHSEENKPHLRKWTDFLEEIGYTSYMQDLNASDYGVAQNRDRTFILSTLGEYNYKFPVEVDLNTCIEDYFEELTDEMALKLIVKSEKAKELLVNLDEEGKLE